MELAYVIAFLGGTGLGLVLALAFCSGRRESTSDTKAEHDPTLQTATCAGGMVTVAGADGTPPAGGQRVAVYARAYSPSSPSPLPSSPPSGGTSSAAGFPVTCTAVGSSGEVVVWVEYRSFGVRAIAYSCSSGSSNHNRFREAISSEAVDAVPKNLSMAPAPAEPGTPTGPAAELVGALTQAPEPVLRYVAEASTPAEPLWRALGGPRAPFEATLVLLHRTGGVGAVLTVVTEIAGRRVQFTWVTSNWNFFGSNRLRCEVDEPGLPALVVGPA